jgi:hypothetical protein
MHRHFMEVPALVDESREAYMQKEDNDRRTDGRLSGLVLTIGSGGEFNPGHAWIGLIVTLQAMKAQLF